MRYLKVFFTAGLALSFTALLSAEVLDFPATIPGLKMSHSLNSKFEPSGGAWHPRLEQLFVVSDSSTLAKMNPNGTATKTWSIPGNWEGVALAKPETDLIYMVEETTATLREFNFGTGRMSPRNFQLTLTPAPGVAPLSADDIEALRDSGDGKGAESLCFVPNSEDPEGGLFYVGSQENGTIYKFRTSLRSGEKVQYHGKIKNWPHTDLSGLEYDWKNNKILAVWDKQNRMMALSPEGGVLTEWSIPKESKGEEGISTDGLSLFISGDASGEAHGVIRYENFRY